VKSVAVKSVAVKSVAVKSVAVKSVAVKHDIENVTNGFVNNIFTRRGVRHTCKSMGVSSPLGCQQFLAMSILNTWVIRTCHHGSTENYSQRAIDRVFELRRCIFLSDISLMAFMSAMQPVPLQRASQADIQQDNHLEVLSDSFSRISLIPYGL
jgi:hypothetical protein